MGYFVFKDKKKWDTQLRISQFPKKTKTHFLNKLENAKSMLNDDKT